MKIVGVAGGSGSGKTTFTRLLTEKLGPKNVVVLAQDNYYIDQSKNFDRDGGRVNFDDPGAIDWPLMVEHLKLLRRGETVAMPIYDFATHKRQTQTIPVAPRPYVIIDGILIFVPAEVRGLLDYSVFIQAREEVRFARRLKRDGAERGRTEDGVRAQFSAQVKPMHDLHVEPSAKFSDVVVSGEVDFASALAAVVKELGG